jgi:hypothetical protein
MAKHTQAKQGSLRKAQTSGRGSVRKKLAGNHNEVIVASVREMLASNHNEVIVSSVREMLASNHNEVIVR